MKTIKIERDTPDGTVLERFVVREVEQNPAVREALARLAAANMDPAAYTKKIRLLRGPAVRAFELGGGARLLEGEVFRLTYQRAEVTSNLAGTVDPVRRVALEAGIASLDRDIKDKAAVLTAAGPPVPDHAAELAGINAEIDGCEAVIRKYKAADLPSPTDLQERVLTLRERYLAIETLEKKRRTEFETASGQVSALTQEALHALGTTVGELARSHFKRVVALLQKDLRRAEVFPDEADPAIADGYRAFQADCDLAERLGRSGRAIEDVCWKELPARESAAVRAVLRLGRSGVPRRRRTTADVADALAAESRLGAA